MQIGLFFYETPCKHQSITLQTHRNKWKLDPNDVVISYLRYPDLVALQDLRTLQLTLGDIFSEFLPAERTEQMEWTDTLKSHLLKEGMTTPTVIQVSFQSYAKIIYILFFVEMS